MSYIEALGEELAGVKTELIGAVADVAAVLKSRIKAIEDEIKRAGGKPSGKLETANSKAPLETTSAQKAK